MNPLDPFLEIVGDIKDRVIALEAGQAGHAQRLAPETRPNQPWTPCTREEAIFYASLKDLT